MPFSCFNNNQKNTPTETSLQCHRQGKAIKAETDSTITRKRDTVNDQDSELLSAVTACHINSCDEEISCLSTTDGQETSSHCQMIVSYMFQSKDQHQF